MCRGASSENTHTRFKYTNFDISTFVYQLLGGFVFFIYYLVFYDQIDDIMEYIWVYWRGVCDQNKCCFHPKVDILKWVY